MDSTITYNKFAAAYGEGSYDCSSYTQGCATIQAPDTGFFAQPPQILYPVLLGIAVLIGLATFLVSRLVRKLRERRHVKFDA